MYLTNNTIRTITIEATPNGGFIATVGCQRFAYTDVKRLLWDLEEYMNSPSGVEKKFHEIVPSREQPVEQNAVPSRNN